MLLSLLSVFPFLSPWPQDIPPTWSQTMLTSHAPGSLSCYVLSLSSPPVTFLYLSGSELIINALMYFRNQKDSEKLSVPPHNTSNVFLFDDRNVKRCFKTLCSTIEEVKLCFVHTPHLCSIHFSSFLPSFLHLDLSYLTACQWPCLSPCDQLRQRWSITTGGGLLLAKPDGPADTDKSALNECPQMNALIGSDRHSRPYASFMPHRPQKPGVGRYVWLVCLVSLCV